MTLIQIKCIFGVFNMSCENAGYEVLAYLVIFLCLAGGFLLKLKKDEFFIPFLKVAP